MALYAPSVIEDIRDRLPVSQIVAQRVGIKRAGRIWRGLCPFHQEKTPSFTCDDQRQTYHCFGCGAHGDVFSFWQQTKGATFAEAIEALAAMAGVQVRSLTAADAKRHARRVQVQADLTKESNSYSVHAQDHQSLDGFLQARSLTQETARQFQLGFSASGFFSGRITIPIKDEAGRVLGFTGRGADPKYKNSPDSDVFRKRTILFNSDLAAVRALEGATLIIVEGHLDAIQAHQHDFASVATMGTAVTVEQVLKAWRLSDAPVFCFDADAAGRKATMKALDAILPNLKKGRTFRFAELPYGDPDSYIRSRGPAAFGAVIKAAGGLAGALWARGRAEAGGNDAEALARLRGALRDLVALIPDADIRQEIGADIRDRLNELRAPKRQALRLMRGVVEVLSLKEAMQVVAVAQLPDLAQVEHLKGPALDVALALAAGKGEEVQGLIDDAAKIVTNAGIKMSADAATKLLSSGFTSRQNGSTIVAARAVDASTEPSPDQPRPLPTW